MRLNEGDKDVECLREVVVQVFVRQFAETGDFHQVAEATHISSLK